MLQSTHHFTRFILIFLCVSIQLTLGSVGEKPSMSFLQSEMSSVGSAQQRIVNFLSEKNIRIGQQPTSRTGKKLPSAEDILSRIAISTKENEIECRISLGKSPVGSKCVAPCGCTGSQKWIQFSQYNKLRRTDPSQWVTCQSCQQPFKHAEFSIYGGLKGSLLANFLENMQFLHVTEVVLLVVISYIFSLREWSMRLLTSKMLWNWVRHLISML